MTDRPTGSAVNANTPAAVWSSRRWACVWMAAWLLVSGCGDRNEVMIQKARVALDSGRPDRAMAIIEQLSPQDPPDAELLLLTARAATGLGQLDRGRSLLDELLRGDPEHLQARLAVVDLAWLELSRLLGQRNLASDPQLGQAFDQTLAAVLDQVQWLKNRRLHRGDSHFFLARVRVYESEFLERQARDAEQRSIADPGGLEAGRGRVGDEADRFRDRITAKQSEAIESLEQVLQIDPRHGEACELMVDLLVAGQRWHRLWSLTQQLAAFERVGAPIARRCVLALLRMPDSVQRRADRLSLCWRLTDLVDLNERDPIRFPLINARLHLVTSASTQARPFVEAVLAVQSDHFEALYFLAQCHHIDQQHVQAESILTKLRARAPASSQVHTLLGLVLDGRGQKDAAGASLRRATRVNPADQAAGRMYLAFLAREGVLEHDPTELDEYLRHHPGDLEAIRYKIRLIHDRGDRAAVERWLEHTDQLSGSDRQRWRLLVDGYTLIGQHHQAQAYAQRLVNHQAAALEDHVRLAAALLNQDRHGEARRLIASLPDRFSQTIHPQQILGSLYLERRSFDLAAEHLEKAVRANPSNPAAMVLLARSLAGMFRVDAALAQLDQALALEPDHPAALAAAFRINQMAGRAAQANEHLERLQAQRLGEQAHPGPLAQLRIQQGRVDEALAICRSAIAAGDRDPVLRLIAAAVALKNDHVTRAEHHLLAMVRSNDDDPQVYALLGQFYVEQGLVDRGRKKMAALEAVNEPLARMGQASMLFAGGRWREALGHLEWGFDRLIQSRSPTALYAADLLAKVHLQRENPGAAEAVFDRLIDADLRRADAWLRRIDLAAPRQRPEETIDQLDRLSQTLGAGDRPLRMVVIDRYRRVGAFERALAVLDRWGGETPHEAVWLQLAGDIWLDRGEPSQAVKAYQDALALRPGSVALGLKLAAAHAAGFDYPASERVALAIGEAGAEAQITALSWLGRVYFQLGLVVKAVETFERLHGLSGLLAPDTLYAMGQAFAAGGLEDRALEHLVRVPAGSRVYPQSQLLMAQLEAASGHRQQARERVVRLVDDDRTRSVTVGLLGVLDRDGVGVDLQRWADEALGLDASSASLALRWLPVRASLAADAGAWPAVLTALEQISDQSDDPSLSLTATRVAVLIHLSQLDRARALYRTTNGLAASRFGPALALALGLKPQATTEAEPVSRFLAAVATGDLAAARRTAESFAPRPPLYGHDLLALLSSGDVRSEAVTQACVDLGVAWVALQGGLEQLAEAIADAVGERLPALVVAHAVGAGARLASNGQPVALELPASIGSSGLALFLSGREKASRGDHLGAAVDLKALLDREPGADHERYQLAAALAKANLIDEAAEVFEQVAIGDSPYRLAAANDLAYLLAKHRPDQLDRAYRLARRSIDQQPRLMQWADTIGWIEHLRGRHRAALKHLVPAVRVLSDVPEVHYHLGVVYQALGDPAWARYHLRQAARSSEDVPEVAKAKAALETFNGLIPPQEDGPTTERPTATPPQQPPDPLSRTSDLKRWLILAGVPGDRYN